jgi:hypothetical protein
LQPAKSDHIGAEGQLHGRLVGLEDGAPFLHRRQADGHGQQAEGDLAQQVGDQPGAAAVQRGIPSADSAAICP